MENQHREIKGYRELNQVEIDLMNEIKEHAAKTGELVKRLEGPTYDPSDPSGSRWLAIGKTDLQKGFMALTRAIARPDFF